MIVFKSRLGQKEGQPSTKRPRKKIGVNRGTSIKKRRKIEHSWCSFRKFAKHWCFSILLLFPCEKISYTIRKSKSPLLCNGNCFQINKQGSPATPLLHSSYIILLPFSPSSRSQTPP